MDDNSTHRRWSWPLAFFILNLAAIAAWFIIYPGIFKRDLTVAALTPGGTENGPEQVMEIRLDYSLPLDPATVGDNAMRFIPPIPGKARLAGPAAIVFQPREPLRSATSYTVVPSPEIRGERGEIPKPELLEFATTRFKLLSCEQIGYTNNTYTLELTFNQPIASSDLAAALQSEFSLPATRVSEKERVQVVTNTTDRVQRLHIDESRKCHLLITLPAGLAGSAGPLGLAADETILCRIQDPFGDKDNPTPEWAKGPADVELTPAVAFHGMTAEWDDGSGLIRVRTTSPLDPARAKEYVKISPSIPVTFSWNWNGLKIMGDFKPGKQYRVTLASGMPATNGGDLTKEISRQVWFDDLPPSISFTHGGGFLSPEGLLKVPVKTRNVKAFNLGIRRLYASNVVETLLKDYGPSVDSDYSEPEVTKTIATKGAQNQEYETLLDLRELVGPSPLGVYGIEVAREDQRWNSRETLVAVSDLGLGVRQGREHLLAWATSIREGTPREGAEISVYSNKRQLMAKGVTGPDGIATLSLPPLPKGEQAALVLGEGEKGEFSFVRLESDNRSRGSEARQGSPYASGFEAFLSVERGVYRGGESVLISGLARTDDLNDIPELPLELRLVGPDQKTVRTIKTVADALGRFSGDVTLGESFPGGIYTIEARLPGQEDRIGSTMFRIADYLPETLSIAMEFEETGKGDGKKAPLPNTENSMLIKVSRLAGGELGRVPATMIASYSAARFAPKGWEDWTFGDSRLAGRHIDRRERDVDLSPEGTATVQWSDPELPVPAAALMTVRVEARDMGGRAASELLQKTVHPVPFYTGILPPKRSPSTGEETTYHLTAVQPDGILDESLEGGWTAKFLRIEYTGVMKRRSDGSLGYEWVRREIPEADLSGDWKEGKSQLAVKPNAGGQYRLLIDVENGRGCVFDFFVSGPGAEWHGEDPETLTLTLDRDKYKIGEKAVVTTASPFAGIALITVETDEVLSHWTMEFKEGENSFEVPVYGDMRPNAYVGVTLLRPAKAEEEWRPHRLSGTAQLSIDNTDRRLLVEVTAPEAFSPGKEAEVSLKVSRDGKAAAGAAVVLWAVDVGVLSLTGYQTPSPWEVFYRPRRAGVTEADMFSRLAPELVSWLRGEASPGGGDYADGHLARRLNPVFANRVRAAVIHNATLKADADGIATATLPIPEFAGRLRLMCWSASGDAMGAVEKEVEVKAPISVSAAWPRFGAPGDSFDLPLTVINRSGATGTAIIVPEGSDNLVIEPASMEVELADNQTKEVRFRAVCGDPGVARATITATLGEDSFSNRVEFSIRPPVLFAREAGNITLAPGENRTLELAPGLLEKNSSVKLIAGGHPLVNLAGSLDYLLSYPYGCAEQTAARLLALVYLPDLMALSRPGQVESGEVEVLATACIERLRSMQSENGAIRMWPKGDELFWVSTQALFTLTESRSAGYAVPDALINNLANYLDSRFERQLEDEAMKKDGGESAALSCLGMAKAGKLKRSWLLRLEELADSRAKQSAPLSSAALAFLCEAVAMAGDTETAKEMYGRYKPSGPDAGVAGSKVIDLAAWLMTSMALGVDENEQALYANELGLTLKEGFTAWSTKENSLILTALGRYWQKVGPLPEATAFLRQNGVTTRFSTRRGGSWDNLSAGTRVDISNPAEGSLRLFWLAEGVPLSGKIEEEDKGMVARRRIFDSAGHEVPGPFELNRGEVYEVRLSITGKADDLVLVDMLPAGLEIEDATLKGRQSENGDTGKLSVKNVEVRDDRLLVFASLNGSGEYRYLARAVTGGRFAWPALDASRMYDAATRSVHGAGRLTVRDKEAANDQ